MGRKASAEGKAPQATSACRWGYQSGEHLVRAVGAAHASEAFAQIAALEVGLERLADDGAPDHFVLGVSRMTSAQG